jgi:hypothetical protein
MAKIQPAVQTFKVHVAAGRNFVDLSELASVANRRALRQGLNWVVSGFTCVTDAVCEMTISKLPNTWICSNAWHKAYAHWKKQQDAAVGEAGLQSTVAKYRDFKIFASQAHKSAGFGANLPLLDGDNIPYAGGDWDHSQIVIPNDQGVAGATVEYAMHMVGDDMLAGAGNSFGLINNYQLSRSRPFSPDPSILNPEDSFYSQMIDLGEIQDEVVENASDRNNDLPYTQTNYPGGAIQAPTLEELHVTHFVASTTVSQKNRLAGSNFPCGLIEFNATFSAGTSIEVFIHLVPGPVRGYLTQSMQDM